MGPAALAVGSGGPEYSASDGGAARSRSRPGSPREASTRRRRLRRTDDDRGSTNCGRRAETRPVRSRGGGHVDPPESDLAAIDPAEFAAVAGGAPGTKRPPARPRAAAHEVPERSQRLWWYLLFAGFCSWPPKHSSRIGSRSGGVKAGRTRPGAATRRNELPERAKADTGDVVDVIRKIRTRWRRKTALVRGALLVVVAQRRRPDRRRVRLEALRFSATAIVAFRVGTIAAILGLAAWVFGRR